MVKKIIPKKPLYGQPKAGNTPTKPKKQPQKKAVEVVPDDSDAGLGAKSAVPKAEEVKTKAVALRQKVVDLEVMDVGSLELAGSMLKSLKRMKEDVDKWLGPQKKATWDAYQIALKQYKAGADPVAAASKIIKGKISDYQVEQDRKIQEARHEMAEANDADFMPVAAAALASVDKTEGVVSVKDFDVEVTDLREFLTAVCNGACPIALPVLVTIKTSVIKGYIKATGIRDIPGVTIKDTFKQAVTG